MTATIAPADLSAEDVRRLAADTWGDTPDEQASRRLILTIAVRAPRTTPGRSARASALRRT